MRVSRRGVLAGAGALLAGCSGDGGDSDGRTVTSAAVPTESGDASIAEVRALQTSDPEPEPRVPAAHLETSLDRLSALVGTATSLLEQTGIRYVLEDRQRIEGARRFLDRSARRRRRTLAYLREVREEIREVAGVVWHLRAIAGRVAPATLPDPREPAAAARRYGAGLAYRGEPEAVLALVAPAERLLRGAVRAGERFKAPDVEPGTVGWPEAVRGVGEARAGARRSLADGRALVEATGNGPSLVGELEAAVERLPAAAADEREPLRDAAAGTDPSTGYGRVVGRLVTDERVHERRLGAARDAAASGWLALATADLARVLARQQGARRALSAATLTPGEQVTPALALSAKRRAGDRIEGAASATVDRPFARCLLGIAVDHVAAGDKRLGGERGLEAAYGAYLLAAGIADAAVPVTDRLGG